MPQTIPEAVLFDLDGTLSDSAAGIIGALRLALDELGLPRLDPVTEQSLLGPPFHLTLPPLVGPQHADEVLRRYRGHYRAGLMFDTRLYDGVVPLLAALVQAGTRLAVATSKPEEMAAPIVERLGLDPYFEAVCGDTLDGRRSSKALVVGEALRRLNRPAPGRVLMVGDRHHDVEGAGAHGVACLGAGWGYGLPGELVQAGARAVYASPGDLHTALLPG